MTRFDVETYILKNSFSFFLLQSFKIHFQAVKDYAFSIGMVSTAAIVIQWTPQIIKTYMAKVKKLVQTV